MRRLASGLAVAAIVALSACDSGPRGPGTITAFAAGPSVAGVVLEVQGAGIQSFTARGSSRVYSAAVEGPAATHRVVIITPDPGEMVVDIAVDDLGMEDPAIRVVSAANGANEAIARSNVTVRLER
ncbi:MAG: hypothetical protein HKN72_10785 [Gemmatimonadetes bacterium]|nr:hypothetical protein [Gemmatimonadota bacterium]